MQTYALNIPGYVVGHLLYEGRNNFVLKAIREIDRAPVIIKILKDEYPNERQLASFKLTFSLIEKIPSKIKLHEYKLEKCGHRLMLVSKDLGGEPLISYINKSKLGLKTFLELAIGITQELGEIHQQHIIHKDIKPQNILVDLPKNFVTIVDFDISTQLPREVQYAAHPELLEGTLAYISPEQTGRMNRSIDYRTDIYSLGVTFYQMLSQRLPFAAINNMDLIYQILTEPPKPLNEIVTNIPKVISDIILKCLSKSPEQRYHSVFGLKNDLERCLIELETTGEISSFNPGEHDVYDHFKIPQLLYGRQKEISNILEAFERSYGEQAEILLVTGQAGVGKSSVINEIQKQVIQKKGNFISGKFDQFKRNIPYHALTDALEKLIQQIMTKDEAELSLWKTRICHVLGANGQIIIDLIPQLEAIIGPQPALISLDPKGEQVRFQYTFESFIDIFLQPDHPLVIFLDDLQWADEAPLALIKLLMCHGRRKNLFVIGAYRDTELSPDHPLISIIPEMKEEGGKVGFLEIKPLDKAHVKEMILDTFYNREQLDDLSDYIYQKTKGNPFFIVQFLRTLVKENLVSFNNKKQIWVADLPGIEALQVTDNVADLMISKIKQLPLMTQNCLKTAAAVGYKFDAKTLCAVQGMTAQEVEEFLLPALQEELIWVHSPLMDSDKNSTIVSATPRLGGLYAKNYTFQHDRVQNAAYQMVATEEQNSLHMKIGWVLLQNTPHDQLNDKIIEITNQLNHGMNLIEDLSKRSILAELNLKAGQKALESQATIPALEYLSMGIKLLEKDHWQNQYALSYGLYSKYAVCQVLLNNFLDAIDKFDIAIQHSKNTKERGFLQVQKLRLYTQIHQHEAAIHYGVEILNTFGIHIKEHPTKYDILAQILKTVFMLLWKGVNNLEISDDDDYKLVSQVITEILFSSHFSSPKFTKLALLKLAFIILKHGQINEYNASTLLMLARLASLYTHNFKKPLEFAKKAYALTERLRTMSVGNDINNIYYMITCRWLLSYKDLYPIIKSLFRTNLSQGNLPFALLSLGVEPELMLVHGENIEAVYETTLHNLQLCRAYKSKQNEVRILFVREVCHAMLGLKEDETDPCSQEYIEMIANHELPEEALPLATLYYNTWKCYLLFFSHRYEEVLAMADKMKGEAGSHYIHYEIYYFYHALSLAAICQTEDLFHKHKKELLKLKKYFARMAESESPNHQHQHLFIAAEIERLKKNFSGAIDFLLLAVETARKNDLLAEEALAYELLGKCYLENHNKVIASIYLHESCKAYEKWGAFKKVKLLKEKYPELLQRLTLEKSSDSITTTLSQTTSTTVASEQEFDTVAVVESLQIIYREKILESLVKKIMKTVVMYASADKAFLIQDIDGKLCIKASILPGQSEAQLVAATPIDKNQDQLSAAIVHYVARSKQQILFGNEMGDVNTYSDAYLQNHNSLSILCLPVIQQDKLMCIIYLENTQSSGVFTPTRTKILTLLASQIAISLENAYHLESMHRLYSLTERFVPKPFLELLGKDNIEAVKLGDNKQIDVTIMFADIRNFTTLSEKLQPESIALLVNTYLGYMAPIIRKQHGYVQHFLGDGILALFPRKVEDAITAALEMQQVFSSFNEEIQSKGFASIEMGIGINYGPAMLSILGEAERLDANVLSDAINTTSRIESLNKLYKTHLLLGEAAYQRLLRRDKFLIRMIDKVFMKGKTRGIVIYEVMTPPDNAMLEEERRISLFNEAFAAYAKGDFTTAETAFKLYLQQKGKDSVAELLLARCIDLQKTGAPLDWDGTTTILEK